MAKEIDDIIIDRLSDKALEAEEEEVFARWYEEAGNRRRYYEWKRMRNGVFANAKAREVVTEVAWQKVNRPGRAVTFRRGLFKYAAVAFVLLSMGIAFYWLRTPQETLPLAKQFTVEPGKKQAVLTLSTGEQIPLTDSVYQTVTKENGIVIRNNAPNMLVYDKAEESKKIAYNNIYIPRGGEYKLILSDGTIVWLNSESRLTYPIAFAGDTRELELEGEAFFEVTKDDTKPFIVHTSQFDIRVTGTQFNVRAYPEETESATLAEGSIQLEKDRQVYKLAPGQQAYLNGEEVRVKNVNLEDAIAWRYNAFSFKRVPLSEMMDELSRWYDIDVFYQNPEVKALHFTAWFRRNTPIKELLEILEKTQQVKLELKGKTLIVYKDK